MSGTVWPADRMKRSPKGRSHNRPDADGYRTSPPGRSRHQQAAGDFRLRKRHAPIHKKRQVKISECLRGIIWTARGAATGVLAVHRIDPTILRHVIPWLLVLIAVYTPAALPELPVTLTSDYSSATQSSRSPHSPVSLKEFRSPSPWCEKLLAIYLVF